MKRWIIFFLMIFCCSNALAAVEWNAGAADDQLQGNISISDIDYNTQNYIVGPLERLLSNYKDGMQIQFNSSSQLTISAGAVTCSNSGGTIRKMRRNTSDTTVTWADIDTGSESSSTTYYVYAVCDADATTATFKISTQSAGGVSGVTSYRRLGYFYNDSSSNITRLRNDNVIQYGDWSAKTVEIIYQAATDGIVTAWGGATSASGFLNGLTDGTTNPSTRRAYCEPGTSGKYDSITFPVKAGDYYRVDGDDMSNTGMYFLPLE